MIRTAYLMEMTIISDQKISDTMPSTASGDACPPGLAAFAATFSVYSGLVPMSPKTTPMHARAAAAQARRTSVGMPSLVTAVTDALSHSLGQRNRSRSASVSKLVLRPSPGTLFRCAALLRPSHSRLDDSGGRLCPFDPF